LKTDSRDRTTRHSRTFKGGSSTMFLRSQCIPGAAKTEPEIGLSAF
jgi:hypothetical protein